MLATSYPFLNLVWTMLVFFAWVLWFVLLFRVFGDIFRRQDISGWGKAGWLIFTILLPFLGVFVYLIARGGGMHERAVQRQAAAKQEFDSYVQHTAHVSTADELAKLADLKSKGTISEAEFERMKAKLVS